MQRTRLLAVTLRMRQRAVMLPMRWRALMLRMRWRSFGDVANEMAGGDAAHETVVCETEHEMAGRDAAHKMAGRVAALEPAVPLRMRWRSGSGRKGAVEAIRDFIPQPPGCRQGTSLAPVARHNCPAAKKGALRA